MRRLLLIALFVPALMGARLFDRTTPDFLQVDTAVVTAAPFTVCGWFNTNTLSDDTMIAISDKDVSDENFSLRITSGNLARWRVETSGGTSETSSSTTWTIDTWNCMCAVEASATSRSVYLNGGGKTTNTTSRTPTGMDRTTIGRMGGSSPSKEFDGLLGPQASWSIALTDQEVRTYCSGIVPARQIRADSLVLDTHIEGRSPEFNAVGVDFTVFGTPSLASGPPQVFFPIVAP